MSLCDHICTKITAYNPIMHRNFLFITLVPFVLSFWDPLDFGFIWDPKKISTWPWSRLWSLSGIMVCLHLPFWQFFISTATPTYLNDQIAQLAPRLYHNHMISNCIQPQIYQYHSKIFDNPIKCQATTILNINYYTITLQPCALATCQSMVLPLQYIPTITQFQHNNFAMLSFEYMLIHSCTNK